MGSVNVTAPDTDEEAHYLATSFYQMALGMFRNTRKPLPPPVQSMDGIWTEMEELGIYQMTHYSFLGSIDTVRKSLQTFLDSTNVDEIMVATHAYDAEAKMKSMELTASLFKTAVLTTS